MVARLKELWRSPDWDEPRPGGEQLEAARRDIGFAAVEGAGPELGRYCQSLEALGLRTVCARVSLDSWDRTAEWFLSRNRLKEFGFVQAMLGSPALAVALPEVVAGLGRRRFTDQGPVDMVKEFRVENPFGLDGVLAGLLWWGGPYKHFPGTAGQAKEMGVAVCAELIGDRWDEFDLYVSHLAWSLWFDDIAWDFTAALIDRRGMSATLIMATGTD